MRPSWSSFSSVSRAISRRTPSKPGQHDRAGGVVDDEVDAGEVLERADVAALAADDPPLHVVGRQLHDRDGRLGRMAGGEALHAHREDVAHAPVGVALGLLLDLADQPRGVVAGLVLDLLEQHLLGLGGRHAGDALERPRQFRPVLRELLALALELRLAPGERVLAAPDLRLTAAQLRAGRLGVGRAVFARRGRCRRRSRARTHPRVDQRRHHKPQSDQCGGSDGFHGRSSPDGAGRGPGPSQLFSFGSDRLARAGRTNGCRQATPGSPIRRRLAVCAGEVVGAGRAASWCSPSRLSYLVALVRNPKRSM